MSGTIKEFTLFYNPVNQQNTFSSGDLLQGQVFLEVTKEVTIKNLYIKCKGDANVSWTEKNGDDDDSYSSHERYFKIKQLFIQDSSVSVENEPNTIIITGETYGNVVKPGRHVFPFSFQLPHGNMPPSFKGPHGSIRYILEVTLDRSWKMDRTIKSEFTFVPRIPASAHLMVCHSDGMSGWIDSFFTRAELNRGLFIRSDNTIAFVDVIKGNNIEQNPQSGFKDKKMKLFTSGNASLNATIDRMGYILGDTVRVSTNIDNSSSRKLKLKYSLEQRQTYRAQSSTTWSSKNLFKVVGDPIPAGSKQTVNTDLRIPDDVELTFECGIIQVEYFLKVYLDVPFARDPEIKFLITILPAGQLPAPWTSQPDFQPYASKPLPQLAFGQSLPAQPAFGPSPQPQAAFGPNTRGAAAGLPPALYPILSPSHAYPQPTNPEEPPPSYTDVYGEGSPPPYPAMDFLGPFPSAPQQHPTESARGQAEDAPIFWSSNLANSANQAESHPTEVPENLHHQTGF